MATEQTCSSPANPVEQDYVSAVLMTDEGITCFEYWCSTCVYSDFLSYKAGQNYSGVQPSFTLGSLQSHVVTLGNSYRVCSIRNDVSGTILI